MPPLDYTTLSQAQRTHLAQLEERFLVPSSTLESVYDHMQEELQKGLEKPGQTVAMIPSYVTHRITGEEEGEYLAMDLGGTNLRICKVTLLGAGKLKVAQNKYSVSDALKTGTSKELFDYLAECVDDFLTERAGRGSRGGPRLDMGFTFSFPVAQTGIDKGCLVTWTKGYDIQDAVGKDIVQLLQTAINRKHLNVRVAAIVNDTVGTLLACAYQAPETFCGVILGTGTNAAYYERLDKITKFDRTLSDRHVREMILNMEWGAFDSERHVLPFTRYDNKLDRESINPGKQLFEKMVSGMYLGEIVRNILVDMVDRRLIFSGNSSPELNHAYTLDTAYLSTIEADMQDLGLLDTREVLETILNLPSPTAADIVIVKRVCELVGHRSAKLAASALSALIRQRQDLLAPTDPENGGGPGKVMVGIDGSLYEFYPNYERLLLEQMTKLIGPDITSLVSIKLSKDGSGVGAALTALAASKTRGSSRGPSRTTTPGVEMIPPGHT
ncbi:hexokinase-domain-containing protein [Piptocephalis cylindrospora]|uniref:Phosphotransferase n=1 Tax=Piptocephalis cylindrospora TaxID=1907219 RepID=A0A4P9XY63_9FUNG|nr:hexokinase-domain-containing protein [Piptocephalis cylindrospora]|eukprot:RKP11284.1 hexokinase-domain-containing protein [Piptocephalis cylindrospora]